MKAFLIAMMAAGLAIAGDFSKSCDDITLEDSRYLVAECQRKNSSSQVSKLDLNACYGNNGFSLKAEPSGGAFSNPLFRRCSVVGSQLSCQQKAKGVKGSKSTRIFHDLDGDIYNQDGTLGCFETLGEVR